jgi:4-amino-4-deoxy-L-arabinose transferase-like glycosyltransferase
MKVTAKALLAGRWPAIALLMLLLFVPFVHKAVHIDDIAFLRLSQMIGWNPLVAYPQDSPYQGVMLPQLLPYEITHPLFVPYLLKVLLAVFGENEAALHAAFFLFAPLALWALAWLQRSLLPGAAPSQALLLLLFGSLPAFVVNAQNLMTDVPTLTFLLLGLASCVTACERGSARFGYLGSLWFCLAIFTSYQAAAILPVALVYVLAGTEGRLRRHLLVSLALPLVALLCWLLLVYQRYDLFPLLKSKAKASIAGEIRSGLNLAAFRGKTIFNLAMIGASSLFALGLYHAGRARLAAGLLRWAVAVIFGCAVVFPLVDYGGGERLLLGLFAGTGLAALFEVFRQTMAWAGRRGQRGAGLFLLAWIAVVLLYNVAVLPFGSSRYLLPIFPPLLMVLLGEVSLESRRARVWAIGAVVLSLALGLAAARADFAYAACYRTMAQEVQQFRAASSQPVTVWYVGEWGMRHYLDRAGARYLLAASTEPKAGDYVIIPEMPRFWSPAPQLQSRLEFFASRQFEPPLPLHLFNRRSNAGFYCHYWGLLPYSFASEPFEVFTIYRVR